MAQSSKNNVPPKTRNLPMPVEAKQLYDVVRAILESIDGSHLSLCQNPGSHHDGSGLLPHPQAGHLQKAGACGTDVECRFGPQCGNRVAVHHGNPDHGIHEPVFGPAWTDRCGVLIRPRPLAAAIKMITSSGRKSTVQVTFPEWVAVTVYRLVNGRRCAFTEEVYWLEAYSTAGGKYSQIPTAMWIKRPKGQLAKCGKAASLRTAFPEECGYAAEEMAGKSLDEVNDATVINGQATRIDNEMLSRYR